MKLRAKRNFFVNNSKTGETLVPVKVGQDFELDEVSEGEQIYSLLQADKAFVNDPEYLKPDEVYVTQHPFRFLQDGKVRIARPGVEITYLKMELASFYLCSGHIKPRRQEAWTPARLIRDRPIDTTQAKKMYDEAVPDPPRKNWIQGVKTDDH